MTTFAVDVPETLTPTQTQNEEGRNGLSGEPEADLESDIESDNAWRNQADGFFE